jgi:hypothetical protein
VPLAHLSLLHAESDDDLTGTPVVSSIGSGTGDVDGRVANLGFEDVVSEIEGSLLGICPP